MSEQLQAYCMKCKEKRDVQNPEAIYTKTGSPATQGTCPVCEGKLFRMGETSAHASVPKPEKLEKPKRKKETKKKTGTTAKGKSKSKKRTRRKNIGKLVIVESPAKARSVEGFLGKGYTVLASKGHVRDLLKSQLSVDVENNFEPKYRVMNDKRDIVKELKEATEYATEVYIATDPDREGEAIAWHILESTEVEDEKVKRVVFHEITEPAVEHAFNNPRAIDIDLVNAQQARRILDRLVGYNISPLLWNRVRKNLSAGRVQSVALRIVVEREREIEAFVPVEYWTLEAELQKQPQNGKKEKSFIARLLKINNEDFEFNTESDVTPHLEVLEQSQFIVDNVKKGTRIRKPYPPFTTSTLQQEASRRHGFRTKKTMMLAQQLYEGITVNGKSTGLITYMRTDSLHISPDAQKQARTYINQKFGKDYVPKTAPKYKTKSKGAQEAHEAIRPTSVLHVPSAIKNDLSRDQFKLYNLIWERFVASQMANAIYDTIRVDINAGLDQKNMPYLFRASGSILKFKGFLALYEETRDEDTASDPDEGRIIPELTEQELLDLIKLLPEQHFTQPPPRYSEASLVRTLEEYGIGRPSTYAPTVGIIQDRGYVDREDKRLIPTDIGKIVNDLLIEYFPDELDYQFTARMEDQLDTIAEGDIQWQPMLQEYYSGFESRLEHAQKNMPMMQQQEEIGRDCPVCGNPLLMRYSRRGKFIGCSNFPDCRHTEPFLDRTGILCPTCGDEHKGEIVARKTRKGRTFYGCDRYPDCGYTEWKLPPKNEQRPVRKLKPIPE